MTDAPWQDRLLARLADHERDRGPAPREGLPSLPSRFTVTREIARGGWGIVLEADDAVLGRKVALKILPPDRVARLGDRFVNEAQVASRLEHPAIVPVYDLGRGPDGAWLCMRLVKGEPLSELLERLQQGDALAHAAWPLERLVDAVLRVAEAVAYAHSQDVIHRDIKPGNVLTGRFGEVFLADFGLAKYLGDRPEQAVELSATRAGVVLGTPGFMPPEQFAGQPDLDAKVDVYALGALLYNVLTLTIPEIDPDTIVAPRHAAPPGREVPEALAAVAMRCLEGDPTVRYRNVAALVDDLRAWRERRPLSVYAEPWPRRAAQRLARHPALSAAVIAAVVVSAGFGAVLFAQNAERNRSLAADRQAVIDATAGVRARAAELATLQRALAESWGSAGDPRPLPADDAQRRSEVASALAACEVQLEVARAQAQRVLAAAPADKETLALQQELDLIQIAAHLEREVALEAAGFPEVRAPDADRLRTARRLLAALDEQQLAPQLAERHATLARQVAGSGSLVLEVVPEDTPAQLLRVLPGPDGIYQEALAGEAFVGSSELPDLERGSYVLVLGSAATATVRVPFLLERNEVEQVRLVLPDRVPSGMAYVPAGEPLIGGGDGRFHKARIQPFFVATHEVTLAEWIAFLRANGARRDQFPYLGQTPMLDAELRPAGFRGHPLSLNFPVFGITPAAAEAYCAWRSAGSYLTYSLPSEAEWEYAIRGADGRPYPWGERFVAERANTELTPNELPSETWWAAVGRYSGDRGPFGLLDGAGNVTELTTTRYGVGGARDSLVIKGGAFSIKQGELAAVSFRQAVSPDSRSPSVGFRVIARPQR